MAVEGIFTNVGTKIAEMSVDKAVQEARYLCFHQSYVNEFDDQRMKLSDVVRSVREDIKDARDKNETRIDPVVEGWLREADALIEQDTKAKTKWFFGMCTNWIWQNRRSKELEEMVQKIAMLIQNRSSFPRVARKAGPPGMGYYSSPDFMYFESRKKEYEQLKEALRNERNHMIGLQGMGGTGKTTMAAQVGKELEESKAFDRVIFVVVSTPPDVKKIQSHIARHLGLTLEEGKGSEEHALNLWSRIANGGEKILIILDDVWDKDLNLKDIGIPHGQHQKGRCSILITTRYMDVCEELGCQGSTIELGVLYDEDAVNLFLLHADKSVDHFSDDLKAVALAIVNECGRLPVAIVAMARALKKCSLEEWRGALRKLQNSEPDNVHVNLKGVYNSLKLSYDNLGNEKAKSLFLLCSLFPEDFEVPMLLFSQIAIGLGLCGEADEYYTARSQVPEIKYKLLDSCLLLKGEKEYVKMHDLIREMALLIGNKDIQVVMDSKTTLKENIRYSSWVIDGFHNHFGSSKLEFLLVQINVNDPVEVPDSLFEGMVELRVLLFLCTHEYLSIPAPSLLKSIRVLNNIRTLCLSKWDLGDISVLGKLQTLEALELVDCAINDVPNEIREMKKLRLLGLIECTVSKNNPFEVIERCIQLEELYYINNSHRSRPSEDGKLHCENGEPLILRRYHIEGRADGVDAEQIGSTSRCFIDTYLKNMLSKAMWESLVARAEILELGEYYEAGWRNFIPDIVPLKEDSLIRLSLHSLPEMECLIYTKNVQSGSDESIFSKLVELQLYDMDVKELCSGPFPKDFLKKLEELCLQDCLKLESTLFREKLDLGNLKLIRLHNCSITSLFYQSTAQSLRFLETLEIYGCYKLKCVTMDEGSGKEKANDDGPSQKIHEPMFPRLRFLDLRYCGQIECVFPICSAEDTPQIEEVIIDSCRKLKYIFGQYQKGKEIILHSLKKIVILRVSDFINIYPKYCHPMSSGMQNSSQTTRDSSKVKVSSRSHKFSWASMCCFLPKSSATSIENPTVSEATLPEYSGSLSKETKASKTEWIFDIAESVLRQPLNPQDMRDIEIPYHFTCSTAMFTQFPITSLFLMERLAVDESRGMKEIVADKDDNYDSINCELRYLLVSNADNKLRYMLKRCSWEDNPPLENQDTEENIKYLFSLLTQAMEMQPKNLKHLYLENEEIDAIYDSGARLDFVGRKWEFQTVRLINLPIRFWYEVNDGWLFTYITKLEISGCQRLKFIINDSICGFAVTLKHLVVSNCQDLVCIIEENEHFSARPELFSLSYIEVSNCKRLKCLSRMFERFMLVGLKKLKIEDAPALVQVFGYEEDEATMVEMDDLCPQLSTLQLINLPSLRTVFQGNDFWNIKHIVVLNCPRISKTSSTTVDGNNEETDSQLQEDPYYQQYEVQAASSEGKLSPSQIQEIEEASDEDDPKLNGSLTPDQTIISESSKPSQESCVIPSQTESLQNTKVSVGEGPSSEKDIKLVLSTHLEQEIAHFGPSTSAKKSMILKEVEETTNESSLKETTSKTAVEAPPTLVETKDFAFNPVVTSTEDTSPLSDKEATFELVEKGLAVQENNNTPNLTEDTVDSSGQETPKLQKIVIVEEIMESDQANASLDPFVTLQKESSQGQIIFNQIDSHSDEETKVDQLSPQTFEEDDLIRLFRIMEKGVHVGFPNVSHVSQIGNNDVVRAFADLEASLKMSLEDIACSEEKSVILVNALNVLSIHYHEEASSNDLKLTIKSLHQEIPSILSSFKQTSTRLASSETSHKLEETDKYINEELPQRKETAMSLVSEIHKTQQKEVKLKEQLSSLQAELKKKEREIKDCEMKLSFLQEQKRKSVSETICFLEQLEGVKKERSQIMEDRKKLRQQLEKWSSCVAKWWKATLL